MKWLSHRKVQAVTDVFTQRCMPGWRGAFCVLDNLAPHKIDPSDSNGADHLPSSLVGRRGFGWVCWLHDHAMFESFDWRHVGRSKRKEGEK